MLVFAFGTLVGLIGSSNNTLVGSQNMIQVSNDATILGRLDEVSDSNSETIIGDRINVKDSEFDTTIGKLHMIVDSDASTVIGTSHRVLQSENCTVIGMNGHVNANNAVAIGSNLYVTQTSVVLGAYNSELEGSVFAVGNGTHEKRSNALSVMHNGSILVGNVDILRELHLLREEVIALRGEIASKNCADGASCSELRRAYKSASCCTRRRR